MLKFFGILALIGLSFGLGYVVGRQPVGILQQTIVDLQKAVKDLSRNVMDTTLGIEKDLRKRQGLVDAKARVVQAKADLFDRNFGDAAKELAEAVDSLENAERGVQPSDSAAIKTLATKIRELRLDVSLGKKIPFSRLDELQRQLDGLLNK